MRRPNSGEILFVRGPEPPFSCVFFAGAETPPKKTPTPQNQKTKTTTPPPPHTPPPTTAFDVPWLGFAPKKGLRFPRSEPAFVLPCLMALPFSSGWVLSGLNWAATCPFSLSGFLWAPPLRFLAPLPVPVVFFWIFLAYFRVDCPWFFPIFPPPLSGLLRWDGVSAITGKPSSLDNKLTQPASSVSALSFQVMASTTPQTMLLLTGPLAFFFSFSLPQSLKGRHLTKPLEASIDSCSPNSFCSVPKPPPAHSPLQAQLANQVHSLSAILKS